MSEPVSPSALEVAQHAQIAAAEGRALAEDLRELVEASARPARLASHFLSAAQRPIYDSPGAQDSRSASVGIVNLSSAVAIQLGYGGRSPQRSSGAFPLGPLRAIVLPYDVGELEVDVDPGDAMPGAGVFFLVLRYHAPQPFWAGAIG